MKSNFLEFLAFSVWTLTSLTFQFLPAKASDFLPNFEAGTRNHATIKLCQNIIDKEPRPQNAKASSSASELPYFNWRGNVGMIGLKYKMDVHGFPEVTTIFPGTPSQKAQLHIGDKIKFIDDVPTDKLTTEDVTGLLVGAPGTRVTLTVDRNGAVLKKSMIRMHSKDFARINPKIFKLYLKSVYQ